MARSRMAIVNGIGYDTWASKLLAANPSSGRARARRRLAARPLPGRQPAPVVLAGERAPGDRADHGRLTSAWTRPTRPTSGAPRGSSKRPRWPNTTACAADPRALRGRPGGLLREHLPAAGRKPRPEADDALQLRQGDRRGNRRERPGQADGRPPGAVARDQGVGLQQPERHTRRAAGQPARTRSPHPDHDRHRDALTGLGYLRAVAERPAEEPVGALHRATGR